ncbi:hypothetical protein [Marinobacterium lutimaris]|uniref:Phage tail tube protein n=1 Tax=Marinobacterium lutimaris TaxID=568106 RepID=A0A1H5XTA8_9GAMM|nr:hypothetical protein [Marinobacterium lutimaris]SEG14667.1 hypothetical protein SAMN05444390_1011488 [Marinobacterium lutimaris]
MPGASIAVPSQGTVWEIEDPATPGEYIQIKGHKSYQVNEGSPPVNDETVLDSTYQEKSIGLPDAGNIALTVQRNTADPGQAATKTHKAAGALTTLRVTETDSTVTTYDVFVMSHPWSGSANGGGNEGTINFEVSGEPVEA